MVVILQQTTDNGKRFVSTIVEEQQQQSTVTTRPFSGLSQTSSPNNSVSEQSAIYKQRIDSLFGYPKGRGPPRGALITGGIPIRKTLIVPKVLPFSNMGNKGTDIISEDEGYQRIDEDGDLNSSLLPDSLNFDKGPSSKNNGSTVTSSPERPIKTLANGNQEPRASSNGNKESRASSNRNQEPRASSNGNQKPRASANEKKEPIRPPTNGNHGNDKTGFPWRSRTYCNMSNSNFAKDLQRQLDHAQNNICLPEGPTSSNGILQFPAQYLGSVPIQGTTTTLQDLQSPLRALYLNFLRKRNVTNGQLSIAGEGLLFEGPRFRLLNPFSTISVWAAIKFVARGDPVPTECAFMPLISDPEGQDKRRLFGKMDPDLGNAYVTSMTNSSKTGFRNPPIFACVTREVGLSPSNGQHLGSGQHSGSECHGFTCKSAEDAIVVAANLYQYLLVNELKMNKEGESGYGSLTNSSPMTTNQNSSNCSSREEVGRPFSSASSLIPTDETASGSVSFPSRKNDVKKESPHLPTRPPRRHKSENVKEYNSDDSSSILKTPIQRRKSFKPTYSRYQRTNPVKLKKRVKISTPPEHGPSDETIERVLDKMLNPRKRSLDDLKPSYKKLILKLALILTHDHGYKKSKEVSRKRQGRFLLRTSKPIGSKVRNVPENEKAPHVLLRNLSKPFSKMALSKGGAIPQRGTTEARTLNPLANITEEMGERSTSTKCRQDGQHHLPICSGCLCSNCSEKCYCSLPTKQDRSSAGSASVTSSTVSSTPCRHGDGSGEERALLRPIQSAKKLEVLKRKDKGCGYDTESCAESEKCYCSLQRVKSNGLKVYNINLDTETSDTDTNSYDLESFNQKKNKNPKIHNSDSCCGQGQESSPITILKYNPGRRLSSDSQASREICGMIYRQNVNGAPSTKHKSSFSPNDVDIRNKGRSSPSRRQRKKVLLLSNGSTSSREDLLVEDYQFQTTSKRGPSRTLGHISEDDDDSVTFSKESSKIETDKSINSVQVLDMKKTAEIEAMFTTLNIGPKHISIDGNMRIGNEQVPLRRKPSTILKNGRYSSVSNDFQNSLGYLP